MVREKVLRSMLFLVAMLVLKPSFLPAAEQQGIISKVSDASGSSCFLRFPAIQEETIYWPRPVLKDPSTGDIISFYGPCDYDPLGRLEILRQRDEYQRRQRRLPEGN
jgi:hypothetical protein